MPCCADIYTNPQDQLSLQRFRIYMWPAISSLTIARAFSFYGFPPCWSKSRCPPRTDAVFKSDQTLRCTVPDHSQDLERYCRDLRGVWWDMAGPHTARLPLAPLLDLIWVAPRPTCRVSQAYMYVCECGDMGMRGYVYVCDCVDMRMRGYSR